jgi:hypothetical protein
VAASDLGRELTLPGQRALGATISAIKQLFRERTPGSILCFLSTPRLNYGSVLVTSKELRSLGESEATFGQIDGRLPGQR